MENTEDQTRKLINCRSDDEILSKISSLEQDAISKGILDLYKVSFDYNSNLLIQTRTLGEKYKFDPSLSLKDFIIKFIKELNTKYSSIATKEEKDKFILTIQTFPNKRRSAIDIFRIAKSYYDITLLDVYKVLFEICEGGYDIITVICPNIGKRVYFPLEDFRSNATFTNPYFYTNMVNKTPLEVGLGLCEVEMTPERAIDFFKNN